ncbi:aldo/keto reductase [Haladaptatus pallidirubidus]|uniref:Aldo/keto reductase n=1 Tax=Haladaptatus pallidirubidus TaxID=1008152 RepID=A0AAV3URB1_9EURY|nr:aldo/keto reductase [Haladaptatus pallidirubidus]
MLSVTIDDATIPILGLGTAPMTGRKCRVAVKQALELGYRHVDTAQMYGNEDAVGAGIAAAAVDRADVFVTTKLNRSNLASEKALSSVEASLDRLNMAYIDLLLIHAPSNRTPIAETIEAMNDLQERSLVHHIGVSNFSVKQTKAAIEASATPLVTNQVKYNPYNRQDELLEFCIDRDVSLTAYTPLAKGRVANDETLVAIGERYGKTGAQVALRWLLQQSNVIAIPKASSAEHLQENLDVFDFELTDEEMDAVFAVEGGLVDRFRGLFRG